MASKNKVNWTTKDLEAALAAIKTDKISLRAAEGAFGVPKSTLSFYLRRKAEIGAKPGPSSVLTAMEEAKLVDYAVHMCEIGYGHTKEQLLEVVKSIIDKDGQPNPFQHGKPGRKWW